jgi:hypothetical protein
MEPDRPGVVPQDVYVASLARKRMAAGALCRDQGGRVLLVDQSPVTQTGGIAQVRVVITADELH